jgi:hypothetical protein
VHDLRRRQERLRAARRLARLELLVGFASALLFAFLFVAKPGFTGGGWRSESWIVRAAPDAPVVVGVVGVILGLAWMVRIYRGDPEPDMRSWRYRRF